MKLDFDVVVIGFGPSGAVAASLLGQAGVKTLVIDKSRDVYEIPRAIAVDHEIMRVFQNLGIAEEILPYVAPFTASEHFGAQGQLIRRIDMVAPPYPLGYIPSMVFTQPPVEKVLRAHAASNPNIEIALGTTFKSLIQNNGYITLTMTNDKGETRTVNTKYMIGCDGASSEVRRQLCIALEDLIFDEPWIVIDLLANQDGLTKLPEKSAQYCDPARPTTFIIGPGNHRRWEIMLNEDEDPQRMQTEDEVWQLLSRWITRADGTLWRASSYRFHALLARDWRKGNVFLAGDAAHQQPPFIGQGMCQGIRDVVNLSWKLAYVIAGRADPVLLDSYAVERGKHVRTLTSRIKAIGHMICERDPAAAAARDAKLLADNGGTPPSVTRQDIVPPLETGLLSPQQHPANGTLFPQPWVLQDQSGPQRLDDIAGTGWRLVLDGRQQFDLPEHEPDLTIIILMPGTEPGDFNMVGNLKLIVEQDNVLANWFNQRGCVAALVRPDHYVFGVARTEDDIAGLRRDWHSSAAIILHEKEMT